MADADVTLDGRNCIVDGDFLVVRCLDLKMDAPSRRSTSSGERRALVHGFNDELVINWADDYPGGVTLRGSVALPGKIKQDHVRLEAHDLHLDHPVRRSSTSGHRRALVHGFNDELVLNWADDYPGGTVTHGDFEVQKSSRLRMRNNAGNETALLDSSGNLYLGGGGADGDVVCKNGDGDTIFHIDSQFRHINFNDNSGTTRMRIDTDDVTTSPWPNWPDESSPVRLDLIAEIRRLKEEVIALRAEVDALSSA